MTRTLRRAALGLLLLATGVPRPAVATPQVAPAQACQRGPLVVVGEHRYQLTYCGREVLVTPLQYVTPRELGEDLGHLANLITAATR